MFFTGLRSSKRIMPPAGPSSAERDHCRAPSIFRGRIAAIKARVRIASPEVPASRFIRQANACIGNEHSYFSGLGARARKP